MRWIIISAIVAVALFAWSLSRVSSDALAMAIGLLLGVLSGVPSAALVLAALRGGDDNAPPTVDAYPEPAAEDVTHHTHTFRRLAGMPPLPDRQAQIQELRSYLAYLEAEEVR